MLPSVDEDAQRLRQQAFPRKNLHSLLTPRRARAHAEDLQETNATYKGAQQQGGFCADTLSVDATSKY